ncbi:MAG: hypothetical protein WA728_32930 [Xanthobacteraceae bacterium]
MKFSETFDDDFYSQIAQNRTPEQEAIAKANGHKRELPLLVIQSGDLPATAKELAQHFVADGRFLSNGNAPVMINVVDEMPRATAVTTDRVRVVAHEICRPVRPANEDERAKGLEHVEVTLSKDIARLYLDGLGGEWGLSTFRGTTRSPILEDDGTMRSAEGFDPASGLWCYQIPKVVVPDHPTREDAQSALDRLRHYFRTFPFADGHRDLEDTVAVSDLAENPGLDESVFLSILLTAAVRQSLSLAPAGLFNAPSFSGAGTGKGLLAKSVSIVSGGVRPAAFTSGHNKEELDKRLTAALTEARAAVFLDNFNAKELQSDLLASALTEDPMMVRVFGRNDKHVPLHTRTLITITGNGVLVSEDMARRILLVNLDAQMENPEERKFAPGFLEAAHADRAKLLSDALIIWRWGRQNPIDAGRPLGNYELWAMWCRDPLLALGCKDPVERIAAIKAADPRRAKLTALFDAWWAKHQDQELRTTALDPMVLELIDERPTRNAGGTLKFNRQRVSAWLNKHAGTRVGGYALIQVKTINLGHEVSAYKLQRSGG